MMRSQGERVCTSICLEQVTLFNAPYEMVEEKRTPFARLSDSRYLPPREIQPQKTGTTG